MLSYSEFLKTAPITAGQLNHWCRYGLISKSKSGSGNYREYSDRDIFVANVLCVLSKLGVPKKIMESCFEDIKRDPRKYLVPNDYIFFSDEGEVGDLPIFGWCLPTNMVIDTLRTHRVYIRSVDAMANMVEWSK